ncbi:hypothetical protein TRP8649_01716 [Pelagimonas phthalicica]|uniref:Uncharacterized protein n=1 Tax=Pelagimonas phthalicica TaxID=1037362 RepID=A0A238JA69_9RHOB|nr:hypothetical protein [Pelagimonas phthalicica]TDS93866.1 hypothetical protein CLV87_0356 [Pelagimonas phthalicica]SMX27610.1 hypothetical protein TRP8649_01716 [Pelagimonas phthalicica]
MSFYKSVIVPVLAALVLANPANAKPLFENSVVSNDLEFIKTSDPSLLACLKQPIGRERREMPDKRSNQLFADGVMVYEARYLDGKRLELLAHPDFKHPKAAQAIAYPVAKAIGRLPTSMRAKLSHVVLHKGDHTAFGEDRGRFFVLYSQNVKKRLSTHDLDETVFHESVHATLDHPHAVSGKWRKAQRKDRTFLTRYAERNPGKEDLAETALFAYALQYHPGRLPSNIERAVQTMVPNRLKVIGPLLAGGNKGRKTAAQMCD